MLQTIHDFEDSTAFERFAIDSVYPLATTADESAVLDLRSRPGNITLEATSFVNGREEARTELINDLRPLLFGSAWKVLDLLLELAFYIGGLRPKEPGKWAIKEKSRHAHVGAGGGLPICGDTAIWTRLTKLYVNTAEARHCLIHRRFKVDSAGRMHDIRDIAGNIQADIAALEQDAMCRLAQALAAVTIAGTLDARHRLNLIWCLDQLVAHHGESVLGGGARNRPVEVVIVNATQTGSTWTVDTGEAQARAHEVFPGRPYFDIEVHFPDSGVPPLFGRLEEAPQGSAIEIDPSNTPGWLRY